MITTGGEFLSVVVPVYNSAGTLPDLVQQLTDVLRSRTSRYEVVLVNDGSRDNSWDVISRVCDADPHVRGLDLMRNFGQHNALLAGIRSAQGDVIVTLDDDLQNPPSEMPKLLDKLADGYDVVYGTPQAERHDFWRVIASKLTKLAVQSAMGAEMATKVSTYRAFRTDLRKAFTDYEDPQVFIDVLLTWGTTRFGAINVRHEERRVGKSNYDVRRLFVHALNMITGFSALPLQLASLLGFGFTIVGVLLLLYVLARFVFVGDSVPGFPFLASMVAIFSGVQLFALGIMGEYLARMHFRIMSRPSYVVRSVRDASAR